MLRWLQFILLFLAVSAFAYAPSPQEPYGSKQIGWQFQYDGSNRLTNSLTPLGHSTALAFNDRGHLQSVTQPSQRLTTLGYDARGRKTSRADLVGTTTFQYDPNNNLTNVFENGKTNSWTFDAYDRVSSYRDSDGNLLQYRFDANWNLTNLVYPGGRNVYYAFDSLNRLTNVTDWAGGQSTMTYEVEAGSKWPPNFWRMAERIFSAKV